MDRTGEQARRSICDDIGARVDVSSVVKALTLLWLLPGVSLIWAGFASSGIRSADDEAVRHNLEQTQALAVMLAIFHVVVCAIWALRTWDDLPNLRSSGVGPAGKGRSPLPTASHAAAGVMAFAGMIAAAQSTRPQLLLVLTAFCAFGGSLIVLRAVAIAPVFRPATISAFMAVMLFQLTVGWLHLLAPTGPLAVTLIAQGLLLAWTAIAAAREFGAVQRAVRFERSVGVVSQEPSLRPLPEPAVGH